MNSSAKVPPATYPKSDLAREALQRYLTVAKLRTTPRAKLVLRARIQGIHTDEDVFRQLEEL